MISLLIFEVNLYCDIIHRYNSKECKLIYFIAQMNQLNAIHLNVNLLKETKTIALRCTIAQYLNNLHQFAIFIIKTIIVVCRSFQKYKKFTFLMWNSSNG